MGRPAGISDDQLDVVRRLYLEERKTCLEISRVYGCSDSAVRNYLKKHGIQTRNKSDANPNRRRVGDRLGQIVLVEERGKKSRSTRHTLFLARCDCGVELEVSSSALSHGSHPTRACPACTLINAGSQLLQRFPEIAQEADGWDPALVT